MICPSVSFGNNVITSPKIENSEKLNLSEVNPLESLERITLPFDGILTGLRDRFNIKLPNNLTPGPLKSLERRFTVQDTSDDISTDKILMIAKSGFVLVAQILIAVMELTLVVLKGILGLMD